MAKTRVKVLIVEDVASDAEIILHQLKRAGYAPDWKCVDNANDYVAALDWQPEIILADITLPRYSGLHALAELERRELDIPLIIVSGAIGDDRAAQVMVAGARDFISKNNLARLGPAVKRELQNAVVRHDRRQARALLEHQAHDLAERIKELTCLYEITRLAQQVRLPLPELFAQAAETMVKAFRWPEHAGVRIEHGSLVRQTGNFTNTPWMHRARTDCEGGAGIAIDVCYVTTRDWAPGEPFLEEEKAMLEAILLRLCEIIRDRRLRATLAESERNFRATFEQAAVGITHTTLDKRFLEVNQKFCQMVGYTREELLQLNTWQIIVPEDRGNSGNRRQQLFENRIDTFSGQKRYLRKDGSVLWTHRTVSLARDSSGKPMYLINVIEDITERKRLEAHAEQTFEQAAVGIFRADLKRRIIAANRKISEMTGYSREELLGMSITQISHPDDLGQDRALRMQLLSGEITTFKSEKRYVRKDGSVIWVRRTTSLARSFSGDESHYIIVVEDVTEQKETQQKLAQMTHYDGLTGLPNRALFRDRLEQTIAQARRSESIVGLLFIDLDRFKTVNDTLGHNIGDELLKLVAARLALCVRSGDTVARLSGDEFAVILAKLATAQDAGRVAQKIMRALADPFRLNGEELFVSVSIGITLYPGDSGCIDTLIRNADAAMFDAKAQGRNNYQFYTAAMNARAQERLQLETALRHALERDEFLIHYQPKFSVADQSATGFEALLRWQRPGNGLVPPASFIPVLEETGLIVQAGEWVLRKVCAQIRQWLNAGFQPLPVAINFSPRQFLQPGLAATIDKALHEYGVSPAHLQIEITETSLMHNPEEAIAALQAIKSLGVSIAIDDFGTGYSSLSYLKRFPVDTLKIDRSFVNDIETDAAIVRAVITMAHSLDLGVVAEGVETKQQLEFLARHDCDESQGYLHSKPLPAEQCGAFLSRLKKTAPGLPARDCEPADC